MKKQYTYTFLIKKDMQNYIESSQATLHNSLSGAARLVKMLVLTNTGILNKVLDLISK